MILHQLCNRYGLDTIAAGCTAAFAMECYEKGLPTTADTDGFELAWGNDAALVALVEKIGRREGFGEVLADGVKRAAERIGKGARARGVRDPWVLQAYRRIPISTAAGWRAGGVQAGGLRAAPAGHRTSGSRD